MRRHTSLELDDLRTVVALAEELNFCKRQTKCMVGIFAAHAAGVKSAML